MKKFLACLLIAIVSICLGFTVYHVIASSERISVKESTIYEEVGDTFSIDLEHKNKRENTEIEIISSDSEIVEYDATSGLFTAVGGGVARINFRTTNSRYRNLYCDVLVGEGTETAPYYIDSAKKLAMIGTIGSKYSSSDCYKLVSDIDLSEVNNGYWRPLGEFSGKLDGNGYTIKNMNIDQTNYVLSNFNNSNYIVGNFINAGLFNIISTTGKVYNLKFDNVNFIGSFDAAGVICGINYGTIERVEVKKAFLNVQNGIVGGITGKNISSEQIISSSYSRATAKVDRCSAVVTIGKKLVINDKTVTTEKDAFVGTFGGLIGYNEGGILINSYSMGVAVLGDANIISGGLIGQNEYCVFSQINSNYTSRVQGAGIKNCYSAIKTYVKEVNNLANEYIGGIVGFDIDACSNSATVSVNKYVGNFYDKENLNIAESGIIKNLAGFGGSSILDLSTYKLTNNTKTDMLNSVFGYESNKFLNKANYCTYSKTLITTDSIGNVVTKKEVYSTWDFNNVWAINNCCNDGYAYLTYEKADAETIDEINEYNTLEDAKLSINCAVLDSTNTLYHNVKFNLYNNEGAIILSSYDSISFNVCVDYKVVSGIENTIEIVNRNNELVYLLVATISDSEYEFSAWAYNNSINWTEFSLNSNKELTYLISKSQEQYIIAFNYNGATGGNKTYNKVVTNGYSYGTLPVPVRTGYIFEGWYLSNGSMISSSTIVNLSGNVVVKAYWDSILDNTTSGGNTPSGDNTSNYENGTINNPYSIYSTETWNKYVVALGNKNGIYFKQTASFVATSEFKNASSFGGYFLNTNGYTISIGEACGIVYPFGSVNSLAVVDGMKVVYSNTANMNTRTLDNTIFGGIASLLNGGSIINCTVSANGTMQMGSSVTTFGGIVGRMSCGEVKNCVNNLSVRCGGLYIGGIVGFVTGGYVGDTTYSTRNVNNGTLISSRAIKFTLQDEKAQLGNLVAVGGIVGYASASANAIRVIYNQNGSNGSTVLGCVSSESYAANVGGIVGYASGNFIIEANLNGIADNNNVGRVYSKYIAGGIVGFATNGTIVFNNGNYASVIASNLESNVSAGGIVGKINQGEVNNNCLYNGVISALTSKTDSKKSAFAGGIVGSMWYGGCTASNNIIEDFNNAITISATGYTAYVGGECGVVCVAGQGVAAYRIVREYNVNLEIDGVIKYQNVSYTTVNA